MFKVLSERVGLPSPLLTDFHYDSTTGALVKKDVITHAELVRQVQVLTARIDELERKTV